MSYFAQKNYSQHLGGSHNITIAEAGCLLTSISNTLLKALGTAPDPPSLDQWYLARGDFLYDTADHASDDLAADSITKYNPNIVLSGQGAGTPPNGTHLAIVKFHYIGVHSGQPIDHYCAVDHVTNGQVQIIDSWDGAIKGPAQYQSVYHLPVAWYAYTHNVPAPPPPPAPNPPTPPPKPASPPAGAMSVPSSQQYTVVTPIRGYMNATQAGNHVNPKDTIQPGTYFVFNTYPTNASLINITARNGSPGSWINKAENVPPPPPPPPPSPEAVLAEKLAAIRAANAEAPAPVVPTPTPALAVAPPAAPPPLQDVVSQNNSATPTWGFLPFKNGKGEALSQEYVAILDTNVTDLQKGGVRPLKKMQRIPLKGTCIKDNITYGRYADPTDQFSWWCVPISDVILDGYEMVDENSFIETGEQAIKLVRKLGVADYFTLNRAKIKKELKNVEQVIDGITRKKPKGRKK